MKAMQENKLYYFPNKVHLYKIAIFFGK